MTPMQKTLTMVVTFTSALVACAVLVTLAFWFCDKCGPTTVQTTFAQSQTNQLSEMRLVSMGPSASAYVVTIDGKDYIIVAGGCNAVSVCPKQDASAAVQKNDD